MNELMFYVGLVSLAVSLFIRYLNSKMAKRLEYFVQVRFVEKAKELNDLAKYLDEQCAVLTKKEKDIHSMFKNIRSKRIEVNEIYRDTKNAIKENKVELFYVQEASLLLYNHYKRLCELINTFVKDGEMEYERCFALSHTADNNKMFMDKYFRHHFGMSPEDYQDQKMQLGGKTQDGEEFTSSFSKN